MSDQYHNRSRGFRIVLEYWEESDDYLLPAHSNNQLDAPSTNTFLELLTRTIDAFLCPPTDYQESLPTPKQYIKRNRRNR